jgi:hypothetical protein
MLRATPNPPATPLECVYPDYLKVTLPSSYLGYQTNNQYPQFPPKMSDGRSIVSSATPDAVLNHSLIQHNQIQSNWQYRKFLQSNAENLRQYNFRETANDTGHVMLYPSASAKATVVSESDAPVNGGPYMYKSFYDGTRPLGYESSDLKEAYLRKEQLDSRKVAPYFDVPVPNKPT